MRLEPLTSAEHERYHEALNLYRVSFPHHEQREPASQIKILDDEEYHFYLLYDEDLFVGLALCWETETYIYVEHFCILPELRNKTYGEKGLALLGRKGKTVILEIDPPVDAISLRRKGFYERCGFVANPYPHVHPPYHEGNSGHELVVMSCPMAISQEEYDRFNHHLVHRVMKDVF